MFFWSGVTFSISKGLKISLKDLLKTEKANSLKNNKAEENSQGQVLKKNKNERSKILQKPETFNPKCGAPSKNTSPLLQLDEVCY